MSIFDQKAPPMFDQYSSNNSFSYQPNTTQSVFDSRNDTKTSNNFTSSVFSELNVQEKKYSNFSMVDRIIGLETGSLDNSGEISLAEQYKYKNLDKRVIGGAYNVTLSDIYSNNTLYASHMGLITDSFIGDDSKGIKTFDTMTKGSLVDKHKKAPEKKAPEKKEINKGRAWTKKSAWEEESAWHKKSAWEEEPEWKKSSAWKDDEEITVSETELKDEGTTNNQDLKHMNPGKQQTFSSIDKLKQDSKKKMKKEISKKKVGDNKQKPKEKVIEVTQTKKPTFNEELWLKAKRINMKYGKMLISKDDIQNLENGGPLPDELLPYKELKEKIQEYKKLSEDKTLNIPKRKEYELRVNVLQPLLLERAINGDSF